MAEKLPVVVGSDGRPRQLGSTDALTTNAVSGAVTTSNSGSFDLATSRRYLRVLNGSNSSLSLTNDSDGAAFGIILQQDGVGSRTVLWWSGIYWYGTASPTTPPVLNTAPAAYDYVGFIRLSAGSYLGYAAEYSTTAAPTSASYVTLGTNGTLTNERVLTAGTGITLTDAGAGSTLTVGVTANTYQPLDAELAAIAGLTSAADRLPYFTGSGTASLATFTAAGRAILDDADANAQLTTLGGAAYTGTGGVVRQVAPTITGAVKFGAAGSATVVAFWDEVTFDYSATLTAYSATFEFSREIIAPAFSGSGANLTGIPSLSTTNTWTKLQTFSGGVSSPGGSGSVRIGAAAAASGSNCVAIGASASTGTGGSCFVIGTFTNPSNYSNIFALGVGATVTGNSAFAAGTSASAAGSAVGVGDSAVASGGDSVAVGGNATASHAGSVSIGRVALSSAAGDITFGGFGASTRTLRLCSPSSADNCREMFAVATSFTDTTDAVRTSRAAFTVVGSAARQEFIAASGNASGGVKIGFFGATAVVKPTVTGSRGGNAALASLLTALANLGLVTDSST